MHGFFGNVNICRKTQKQYVSYVLYNKKTKEFYVGKMYKDTSDDPRKAAKFKDLKEAKQWEKDLHNKYVIRKITETIELDFWDL